MRLAVNHANEEVYGMSGRHENRKSQALNPNKGQPI